MKSLRWAPAAFLLAISAGALTTACHPTFVVYPGPQVDSLADSTSAPGENGRAFRTDTITVIDTVWVTDSRGVPTDTVVVVRTDTVTRLDTVEVAVYGTTTQRVDTVLRVDTLRVSVTDTVVRADTVLRVDTLRVSVTDTVVRADTVLRVDTLRVSVTDTVVRADTVLRVDTVRVSMADTVVRADTVLRVDTLRVPVTDTVVVTETVTRVDTVMVAGQRLLFLPPGHFPPPGECRIWVHGTPPGQQAKAGPCDGLGPIPDAAFILFGGEAWDFQYDWLAVSRADATAVPPEIVALQRGKAGGIAR